jgi:phosphoglycerol transferase MdoB-like AlkP superfamily enzyme
VWTRKKIAPTAILVCTIVILFVWFAAAFGEIGIYGEWQSKLNYRAWNILHSPAQIAESATNANLILFGVLILASTIAWAFVYKKWFWTKQLPTLKWYYALTFTLLAPPLVVIGIRGGLQNFPIHQAQVYFSKKQILNDIAVNTAWNLIHSITHGAKALSKNPYRTMPDSTAQTLTASLFAATDRADTSTQILSTRRPNIVLLILESWTGDVIESIGGTAGITPNFARLQSDGFMFTQIYSSGRRSPEGIAALLAGYPALPQITAVDFPEKTKHLPTITQHLAAVGYHTSYYYGGYSEYGNILAFVVGNGFDRITDGSALARRSKEILNGGTFHEGKLGVHDEHSLQVHIADLAREPQPFFSALFTLSTHSPYDHPLQNALNHLDLPQMDFLNSVYYADKCLGQYFDSARTQAWYGNTLFVLVPDHSRVAHISRNYYDIENLHIPMLFYGEVIKPEYRGKTCAAMGNHHDLAATLLRQLGIGAEQFRWSRDLLNRNVGGGQSFAYISDDADGGGLRWKRGAGGFVYNYGSQNFVVKDFNAADSAQIVGEGFAYLQTLFGEFLDM